MDVTRIRGRKYFFLFVTLVILLAVYPILRNIDETRVILDVIVTAVFVAALVSVFERGRQRRAALFLGVPTLIGIWIGWKLAG